MRCRKNIAVLAALAVPYASATTLADLPACALKAATSGLAATGCGPTDYLCLCKATGFLAALQSQVESQCSAADYNETLDCAKAICSDVGITLNIPDASMPTTTAAAAAAAQLTSAAAPAASTPSSSSSASDDGSDDEPASTTAAGAAAIAPASSYGSEVAATSSAAISTTTSSTSTNGSSNTTFNTSAPVPFEGAAAGRRLQWASAAVMVLAVGAFIDL